jgi:PAS domain S-box-containing protein
MKKAFFSLIICLVILPVSAMAAPDMPDFDSMLDEHGAVILLIDNANGEILYANKAAANFYGYSRARLQTMNISEINTLSEEEILSEMQAAASENRNHFNCRHRLSDGEIRDVEVFSYPVEYGGRDALFSIIHDVTDKVQLVDRQEKIKRDLFFAGAGIVVVLLILIVLLALSRKKAKKAAAQVRVYNQLRQTFIDADKSLIYLKDRELKYVFVNRALTELYNRPAEEFIGKDDFMISAPEFAGQIREADQKVLDTNAPVESEIHVGDRVFMSIKFPVELADGSFGVGSTIREITEERAREEFRQKVNARTNILADTFRLTFKNRVEQLDFALNRMLALPEANSDIFTTMMRKHRNSI